MKTSLEVTQQSARLSHRENHRDQPIGCVTNRVMQTFGLLAGLLIVFSMGAMNNDCSGMQEPPHDYMADINAKARSVPEGERAWPLYREALIVLKRDMRELGVEFYIDKPGGEVWDQTVEFIEAHHKEIALIRQAAAMPGLGLVVSHSMSEEDQKIRPGAYSDDSTDPPSLMDEAVFMAFLPHLGYMRNMAKMLAADAYIGMETDDSDRVLEGIQAMLGVAKHSRETPIMICDLVSLAVSAYAFDTFGQVLQVHPTILSDEQLRLLMNDLSALTEGEESLLTVRLAGERIAMHDMIQRVYTDDGDGNEHLYLEGIKAMRSLMGYGDDSSAEGGMWSALLDSESGLVLANRQEMKAECDRLMDMGVAETALPLWARPEYTVNDEIEKLFSSIHGRTKFFLISIMMPSLSRSAEAQERIVMERDATMTAMALELYRRDHEGRYPTDLKVLVPKYLKAIPLDRFNGEPMGYLIQNDGSVILYCVGVDLDDDRGREPDSEIKVEHWVGGWLHPSKVAQYMEEDEKAGTPGAKRKLADGDFLLWESRGDTLDGPS